jgi:parallel beta-helix repeat protein
VSQSAQNPCPQAFSSGLTPIELGERIELVRKTVSGIVLALLLVGFFAFESNIRLVRAQPTIYITLEGNVYPPDAPVTWTWDGYHDRYTLGRDIPSGEYAGIVIQRDDIVLDGVGHTFQGPEPEDFIGIDISERHNVNITNVIITGFGTGICLDHSNYNRITLCNVTDNFDGIILQYSSYNTIDRNVVSANDDDGILLALSYHNTISQNFIGDNFGIGIIVGGSSYNDISRNTIRYNQAGILIAESNYNTVSRNFIADNIDNGIYVNLESSYNDIIRNTIRLNQAGIFIRAESNHNNIIRNNIEYNNDGIRFNSSNYNMIYHNNFIINTRQVYDYSWDHPEFPPSINTWDDGYPSGGNYWSDYTERYPDALESLELDAYGIWDTPYEIYEDNTDHYPLIHIYLAGDVNHDMRVNLLDIVAICLAYGAAPSDPWWNVRADIAYPYYYERINILDIVLCATNYGERYPQFPFS